MELPHVTIRSTRLQQRGPHFVFAARDGQHVEVVGNVRAPHDALEPGARLEKRKGADERPIGIRHGADLEAAIRRERMDPLRLPCPGQERRANARAGAQVFPGRPAHGLEAVVESDLHRSVLSPASASAEEDGAPPLPSSSASVIASSTAESKSSPRSSPNSLPIFFMKRATLPGSFSSRSPKLEESARASMRASSLFTVAKRDISRLITGLPQRGQVGGGAVDGRGTSRLTRRRQSPHSYS